MPLYEYECEACGQRFEVIRKFSDALIDVCTSCGKGPVHKLFSSPAIQFKGSGWYITDYAQKGKSESKGKSDSADTKKESKAESKTESKAESKADASSTPSSTTKS